MPRLDTMTEKFEEIMVLNKPALLTSERLDRTTLPAGYYLYEMRYADDIPSNAAQLANVINVNVWGSVITRDKIQLPCDGYLDITPDDFKYGTGSCRTMKDFMMKYPLCTKDS